MRLEAAVRTDPGLVRANNEDACAAAPPLYAVADGLGGHQAGEIASNLALDTLRRCVERGPHSDDDSAHEALRRAVQQANSAVLDRATSDARLHGMGTTMTVGLHEGERLHLAHVGDSRAYLLREGELKRLTQDHTLVAEMVHRGELTREEAAVHPQRSVITRAVGISRKLEVDTFTIELRAGDRLLLCTDGLTAAVDDEEIAEALSISTGADAAAEALVERANARGGPDNITAVVIDAEEGEPSPCVEATFDPAVTQPASRAGDHSWAEAMHRLGPRRPTTHRPRWNWLLPPALVIMAILGVLIFRAAVNSRVYVGLDGQRVAIFHGVSGSVGPFKLHHMAERTEVTADQVPEWYLQRLRSGVVVGSMAEARQTVARLPSLASPGTFDSVSPSPSSSTSAPGGHG